MTEALNIATREEWLRARVELLAAEKALTRQHDELGRQRRRLPWVPVDKQYTFETVDGPRSLPELFDGRSQLLMYHFMFGVDWDEGCPVCSLWADGFDGAAVHLAHRDVTFVVASRAPLPKLRPYRERMGWSFPWVSTYGGDFNNDLGVSDVTVHNFAPTEDLVEEHAGLSAFALHEGEVFHTYSCFARGLEAFNVAYQLLDLTPKGRDEESLEWTMQWLHRHDDYP